MRASMIAPLVVAALGGSVGSADRAWAQSSGRIVGMVLDGSGSSLAGATVELAFEDNGSSAPRTTRTNNDGGFIFDALAESVYRLRFAFPGFATVTRPSVAVGRGADTRVDVVLPLAAATAMTVTGRATSVSLDGEAPAGELVGVAFAASQGVVTRRQLETRALLRAADALETVTGLVATQHSGEGKANQYYLRGFNLDHGTDFATTVAGVPVNLPTHGHGQGYSDANFLIPELVSDVQFSKGPYFAEQGDFSAAGAADVSYVRALASPLLRVGGGQDGWRRVLAAASPGVGQGQLLAAAEAVGYDGPWTHSDRYDRLNLVARYSGGEPAHGLSLTGMAYRATWNATDQIPARATGTGTLDRFDAIDSTAGGSTSRYSVAAELQHSSASSTTRASAYAFRYDLDLFSNFTYFLRDPENGDQFEQTDSRMVVGGQLSQRRRGTWRRRPTAFTLGAQLRHDHIGTVGLYHTRARERLETVREDRVRQTSIAAFAEHQLHWSEWLRTQVGARLDVYRFGVRSDVRANSGHVVDAIASPKGGIALGPWRRTELYANAGVGFHSNDARGVLTRIDPATALPTSPASPLVRARGYEVGVRSLAIPRVHTTATFWTLGLDSELVFAGDAGTTEAGRPSRRSGVELASYVNPRPWLTLDADLAVSRARLTGPGATGAQVPGALGRVASLGAAVDGWRGLFGGIRLRYLGPRPLVEDGSVRAKATTLVNLLAGHEPRRGMRVALEVFNLLNARMSDSDYFYTSRLAGEPASGIEDIHTHPTPPRSVRVALQLNF